MNEVYTLPALCMTLTQTPKEPDFFILFLAEFIFCQTIELSQLPEESKRCQSLLQAQTCSCEEDISFPSSQFSRVSPRDMPKQPSAQFPTWPALLQNPTATIPSHRAPLSLPGVAKKGWAGNISPTLVLTDSSESLGFF